MTFSDQREGKGRLVTQLLIEEGRLATNANDRQSQCQTKSFKRATSN